MYSPSDLEGEVDHTFFDSDSEDGSRKNERKTDSNLTIKNNTTRGDKLHATSAAQGYSKGNYNETKNPPRSMNRSYNKDIGGNWEFKSNQMLTIDGESDEDLLSKKSNKHFMALMAEAKEGDEDKPENSGTYSSPRTDHVWQKPKNSGHSSPVSSEVNRNSGSEYSYSDSSYRPKTNRTSSSGNSRVGSSTSGNAHCGSADEFEDTVTDVSPLSTPVSRRLQSLDLNQSESENDEDYDDVDIKEQLQSVPSRGFSTAQQEDFFRPLETDEYSLGSQSSLGRKVVKQCPSSRQRKNYSFSNEEVQRIDRENHHLLSKLSVLSVTSRPASVVGQSFRIASMKTKNHIPHSALNRQREHQRIEIENLAFLKRLSSAKPSRGMKRSEQLADYQRHLIYQGKWPVYPSTSRVSSASKGFQQNHPNHQSARASSIATTLSCTPVPSLPKNKASPPAQSYHGENKPL